MLTPPRCHTTCRLAPELQVLGTDTTAPCSELETSLLAQAEQQQGGFEAFQGVEGDQVGGRACVSGWPWFKLMVGRVCAVASAAGVMRKAVLCQPASSLPAQRNLRWQCEC